MIKRINEWLAVHTTIALGTMWCVYAFVVLSVVPVFLPAWMSSILYFSNALQLTFLPLLLVGQNVLGRAAETRAQQDHAAIMDELAEIKDMHRQITVLVSRGETQVTIQEDVA